MALYNQNEAFTLDLGDDQSHYLFGSMGSNMPKCCFLKFQLPFIKTGGQQEPCTHHCDTLTSLTLLSVVIANVASPSPSDRQRLSSDGLEDKREDHQNCSVLYDCISRLVTVIKHTLVSSCYR